MLPRTIRRTLHIAAISILAVAAWTVTAIAVGQVQPQAGTGDRPQFEVASIKPCKADVADSGRSGGGGGRRDFSPGRLNLECQTVKQLIDGAYVGFANGHVDFAAIPVEGGPAWINSDRFTINAKAEGPRSQVTMHGPMLQTLLEDRFKLKIHRESREVPVYALTVARGGSKLQPFKEGSCTPFDWAKFFSEFPPPPLAELPPGQEYCGGTGADGRRWAGAVGEMKGSIETYDAKGVTLAELFKFVLGNSFDRPVIDKTGLNGRFDLHLEFGPDAPTRRPVGGDSAALPPGAFPEDPAGGPSIFTAVQQQLGLKLERGKGPGEFLVIDHVEKPSAN